MDSEPTLAAKPSSLGAAYRRFALSSARNIAQMMRAPVGLSIKLTILPLNIRILTSYRNVNIGPNCSKNYSLPVF